MWCADGNDFKRDIVVWKFFPSPLLFSKLDYKRRIDAGSSLSPFPFSLPKPTTVCIPVGVAGTPREDGVKRCTKGVTIICMRNFRWSSVA